jgi:hypothetical protein
VERRESALWEQLRELAYGFDGFLDDELTKLDANEIPQSLKVKIEQFQNARAGFSTIDLSDWSDEQISEYLFKSARVATDLAFAKVFDASNANAWLDPSLNRCCILYNEMKQEAEALNMTHVIRREIDFIGGNLLRIKKFMDARVMNLDQ